MGRPRNEEEVERLQDTAFELFAVKGLDATSYSDIAKNAYVTKSHVQHYFPKKEMLVARFVDRSMEAVLKIARELPEFEAMDPLSKLVYVDYIQFYYAMYNEKMFRMSMDILLERSLSQAVIDAGIEFDLLHLMKYDEVSHPDELEEAARMDGAGFLKNFFLVMIPCAKGGMASAAVLAFLESWNEFTFALILTSSVSTRTLPLSLSYFTAQFSFNYTALFAAITIAVIPSIVIFAFFQEQVNQSLVAGSVKG